MHKLFLAGFSLALIVVISFGAYYFFFRSEAPNIGLEISRPAETPIGVLFPVTIAFSNYSDKVLTDATLSLILPEGLSYAGEAEDQRVKEESMGDVGPGSIVKQEVNLVAVKDPHTLKRIQARVRYRTANGSKAQFEAQAFADVPVGSPAVELSFSLPEKTLAGERFSVALNYENTSGKDYPNLRIVIDYPPMFRLSDADPKPTQAANQWDLGTVKAGEKGVITLSGIAAGSEQSILNFSASLLASIRGERYTLTTETASTAIAPSAISLSVSVNNEKEYIAALDESLLYILRYRNNSNTALENLTLRAAFTGELYDFATVRTQASLNSLTNTFTWNAANTPSLAKLDPGEEGAVSLPIKVKKYFPIARLGDKNYTLGVRAQIESPTVPSGTAADRSIAIASIESKVKGAVKISAYGLFRDAASDILNKGPYPPRVNQPTQYSIHWQVTNYGTDVSGAAVKAPIKSGARFTGVVKSSIGAKPSYDATSGEVSWQIGDIPAGKGVTSPPLEAVFQIENTPSVNQVGQSVELLGETRLEAADVFTGASLSDIASSVTTDLPNDPTIQEGDRRVQP